MTLPQLQAFVAASALGTFTAAAARLEMSQPAVSDLIRRLEQELGTSLFHRGARSLVLTPAGEELLPHAEQVLTSADLGVRAVRSQVGLRGGIATFGLFRNADFYLKTDLAKRFRTKYPDVRVRLVGQNSAETAADVAAGVLEAGLLTLPIDAEALEVVPLARDEVVFVTAAADRAASPVTTDDFCAGPLVLYDAHFATTDPARRQLTERAQLRGDTVEAQIEVEYLSTALSLVESGFGDSIVCRGAIAAGMTGDWAFTASFDPPLHDVLALVKRRGAVLTPATAELARMAVDALVEHQESGVGTASLIEADERLTRFFGVSSDRDGGPRPDQACGPTAAAARRPKPRRSRSSSAASRRAGG